MYAIPISHVIFDMAGYSLVDFEYGNMVRPITLNGSVIDSIQGVQLLVAPVAVCREVVKEHVIGWAQDHVLRESSQLLGTFD